MMFHRSLTVLLLAILVGATGCSSSGAKRQRDGTTLIRPAAADLVFSESSPRAVIVLGTAATQEISGNFFTRETGIWASAWGRIDQTGAALVRPAVNLSALRSHCAPLATYPGGCQADDRAIQHFLFDVEPGEFMLSAVGAGGLSTTIFTENGGSLIAPVDVRSNKASGAVPWFRVGPGEILYVGAFVFDLSSEPAKLARVVRDDAGARATLAGYPNVRGKMQYRPAQGGPRPSS